MNTNRDMSGSCGRGRFRPGGWRTLLLSLCLLAVACAEPSADGFGGTAGDEAVVRLTISLPQAELPGRQGKGGYPVGGGGEPYLDGAGSRF